MTAILQIKNLTKRYGGLTANNDISFDVAEGEILSVIGPNGAGKSTLFKQIASFVSVTSGEVLFRGKKISDLAPHIVARMGVVRTFQETTIFKSMTVRENIIVAHHLRSKASLFGFFIGSKQARADEAEFGKSADDIVDFLGLQAIRNELASNLPQGHLRALGMAIGLATQPKVLLLDEPFAGMNHDETMKMVASVRRLREGRSPFAAGRDHIHHILQDAGFGPTRAAVHLTWFSFICGMSVALLIRTHKVPYPVLLLGFFVLCMAWYGLSYDRPRAVALLHRLRTRGRVGRREALQPDGNETGR